MRAAIHLTTVEGALNLVPASGSENPHVAQLVHANSKLALTEAEFCTHNSPPLLISAMAFENL